MQHGDIAIKAVNGKHYGKVLLFHVIYIMFNSHLV